MVSLSFSVTLIFTCLLLFTRPVYSWIATEYVAIILTTLSGGTQVYTAISTAVTVTGPVTPISTSISTPRPEAGVNRPTIVYQYISGPNLPIATRNFLDGPPTPTSSSTITVSSAYFAEATITQNPTCPPGVSFSYTSQLRVFPPDILTLPPNTVPVTSSTAYMTTTFYTNAAGAPTASSSWSQADFFVASGNVVPEFVGELSTVLAMCRDPRGCYLGRGEGCTRTGGTQGVTGTNAGPAATSSRSGAVRVKFGGLCWGWSVSVGAIMIAVM
ncbi:hypothetical protein GLAREA_12068 [Glarea lozoyensis ATCC 20868]|uniref:Uncharacterized protein n=1 Tax=Glarea lozoyensis (strain ATCC 20868 / MF5171) TaxID=1116229 RepID=S3DIX4_GLAL2|nr:uncharacterized protein GLAREA_12068 [Glarea lozoyensis ATCC 20868]EPE31986.1 hypothetical protein GLAREA_12068 [Glarea lozoyensis ATCC 20868]